MIDVVIVNWNAGPQLAEAVDSAIEHGDGLIERIIVVDNGSTDGSDALDPHPLLHVVRAGENLGFARGSNRGSREGRAPYILFLNPDARVFAGTLRAMVDYFASDAATRVGICGARLIDEAGKTGHGCAYFPSWRTFVGQSLGIAGKLPGFPSHFMLTFDHRSSRLVDQVIGAFYMVRRPVFEQLGRFDERFFVYYEELDFALRARRAGWLTYYLADATAFHLGQGTTSQVKARRLFYLLRSRILYARKHLSPAAASTVTVFIVAAEPFARLARAALRASPREARDTWHGFRMLWADLGTVGHRANARD